MKALAKIKHFSYYARPSRGLLMSCIAEKIMKPEIHPEYKEVAVACSCGNSFKTHSTLSKDELHIESCSECHPFYTGKQRIVDTAGRVDKFNKRYQR
jgi:large subunit ribosomal protein L31